VIVALSELKKAGYHQARIEGSGDVAEICRLTCMEQNVTVSPDGKGPVLRIVGLKVFLDLEDHHDQQH
jgi:hypothetical protein